MNDYSDTCACGRTAYEAVGDPLEDHEPTCAVYITEAAKRLDAKPVPKKNRLFKIIDERAYSMDERKP